VYALLQRGYEPNDSNFSKLKNMPQPAEVTDDFKKEMNIAFTAKTEQVKVKKGTVQKWFDEQKEKLRKMGVTAFDVKRDYDLRRLVGSGIIDSLKGAFNTVVGTVTDKAKQFGNTISQVITGSTDYSPSVRKILDAEGMNLVHKIVVGRTPVQQAITMALNAVSQGQFQTNQDRLNYDKLFHLFAEVTLENGRQVRVEKNEVITMTMGFKQDADTDRQEVPMTKAVSFRDLLENARRKMKQKFFAYDSANNNCQDFIMALLQGSGLGTQENFEFIKQNTKQLFEKIPRTRALAKQITNLGQRINIAMSGGKISSTIIMPKFAKGSQEARDHMAKIRAMRGRGRKQEDSESDEEDMRGYGTGKDLGKNLGQNLGRLADSGTDKLISMMGTGTHIHHHHYHPASYGGTISYGQGAGHSAEYGSHSGGTIYFSNAGPSGRGIIDDYMGKVKKLKMPKSPQEALEQLQIVKSLTPAGFATDQARKMIGSGPAGLKKFQKWTGAIGKYLGPMANPILEAGRDKAVEAIKNYAVGGTVGAGPKGLKKFKKWTGAIGDYLGPIANPILEAGRDKAVETIKNYAVGRGMKGSQEMKDKMARLRAMRG
jgi:hypothetical protein